tara:strand:+ start:5850 stop:6050 length:201 start_codon:yes stop_codon:yes gene_type:complete
MKILDQANKQNVKGGNLDIACMGLFLQPECCRLHQKKRTGTQKAKVQAKQEEHINVWIYATALDFR